MIMNKLYLLSHRLITVILLILHLFFYLVSENNNHNKFLPCEMSLFPTYVVCKSKNSLNLDLTAVYTF